MFAAASNPRNEKKATMDAANAPCNGGTSGANSKMRAGSPPPPAKTMAATKMTMTRPVTSMIEATKFVASDSRTPRRLMRVSTAMNAIATGIGGMSKSAAK